MEVFGPTPVRRLFDELVLQSPRDAFARAFCHGNPGDFVTYGAGRVSCEWTQETGHMP